MWQDNLKTFVELSKKTQEHIALEAGINQGTLSKNSNLRLRQIGRASCRERV